LKANYQINTQRVSAMRPERVSTIRPAAQARDGWCAKQCRRLHALCQYDQPWRKPRTRGRSGGCRSQARPKPRRLKSVGMTCCYLRGGQAATGHGRSAMWFRFVCSRSAPLVELRRWGPSLVLGASSALIGVRQAAARALYGLAARFTTLCAATSCWNGHGGCSVMPNVRAKADHGGGRRKPGLRPFWPGSGQAYAACRSGSAP
jgi:hypothetical protein